MNKSEKQMYIICAALLSLSLIAFLVLSDNSIMGLVIIENPSDVDTWFYAEDVEVSFKYEPPRELTRSKSLDALITAEKEIEDMKTFDLETYFVEDNLLRAKQSYVGENFDMINNELKKETDRERIRYINKKLLDRSLIVKEKTDLSEVFRLTQVITFRKQQAYRLLDEVSLLEEKINDYKNKGTITVESESLLERAKTSLKDERYDESRDYLRESEEKLNLSSAESTRVKRLWSLGRGFFEKYWLPIIAILFVLTVLTFITITEVRAKMAKNKIKMLKLEKETVMNLMKKVQDDRFNKGTLSESIYKLRMDKYREKLADINRTIPVLEAMSGEKTKKKLEKEREGILKIEE